MDLRFTTPELRRLDLAGTEVLIAALASDERPPHGVAGLVDWRLAGAVSRLIETGFATGAVGEVVLVPGKPKLPFDKVLLFGIGAVETFDEAVFREVIGKIFETLEGLKARTAVVELPGRHVGTIAPDRAADILLERAGNRTEHDVWTLVEPNEAQRSISLVQERRRVRQA